MIELKHWTCELTSWVADWSRAPVPADDFFWNLTETSGLDAAYDITCLQIWIFPLPHGPPSKPKEILIALIPNQSIFIQYQDSCNYTHRPRAHNWNPTFHSSELSFLASVLRLSLLLFSIRASWCWFCLSYTHCLPFSLDSLSDLCLYWLVFFFFLKPPPPTPPCRKAGMCQTVASL